MLTWACAWAVAQTGESPAAEANAPNRVETQPVAIPHVQPGPPPPPEEVQSIAWVIARGLRCPVCRGQSVAESNSAAAVDMLNRIRELVAAGYSRQQIDAFFVDRYGEWVLLEPKTDGLNVVVWAGPAAIGAAGALWALLTARRWASEEDEVPLPSDLGIVPKDKYEAQLLADVEDDS